MNRITSRRNPVCVHLKKLGASRDYRESCGEFLCDGIKLLSEAVKCGAEVLTVLTSSPVPFPLPLDTKVFYAERNMIDSISPLKNSQSVIFSCRILGNDGNISPGERSVLLDGIQDPGNAGTIIRTANAFGIGTVILTGDCADLYNPKTIRATMGAVFRQRVVKMSLSELKKLKSCGVRFVGAAIGSDCVDISCANLADALIAIGSEGKGISKDVLSLCDEKVVIPIAPSCESLNAAVAAGIMMWSSGGI